MKKILKLIKNNYKWIIFSVCLILFLALAEDVFNKEIMQGDIIGYNFVKTYLIKEQVTPVMKIVTFFGGATCLIGLTIIDPGHFKTEWIVFLKVMKKVEEKFPEIEFIHSNECEDPYEFL